MPKLLALVLAVAISPLVQAQAPKAGAPKAGPKLVAILPLDVASAKLDESGTKALEETIRSVTASILSSAGYTLLTGETTLQILADNGIDPSKACEASCAMDLARELKAQLFLSASVTRADQTLYTFVRLFDSESGRQLSMVKFDGSTVSSLVDAFENQAPELFAPLGVKVQARARELLVTTETGRGATSDLLEEVGESAREGALRAAKPAGLNVLSKDATVKASRGTSCASGNCSSVELARAAGADLVLTFQVSVLEGQYLTKLRIEQAKTGDMLASDRLESRSQLDTVRRASEAAEKLVRQIVGSARVGSAPGDRLGHLNTAFNNDPNALDRMSGDIDRMRNPTGPVGPSNGVNPKPNGTGRYEVPVVDRKKVTEVRDGIWDATPTGLLASVGVHLPLTASTRAAPIAPRVSVVWNALQPNESTCVYGFGLSAGTAPETLRVSDGLDPEGTVGGDAVTGDAQPYVGVPFQMTCGARAVFNFGLEPVLLATGGFDFAANIGVGYGGHLGALGWALVAKYHGFAANLSGGVGADLLLTF